MSWASEAVGAIRKIVLVEDRIERLAGQTDALANKCQEMDRRLIRVEAKFDLIEIMAASRTRALPARTQSHKKKTQ